ncbi:BREX-1 system phosphatase PglZ type A [Acinetobacter sp. YH12117]|uniref:BREX-1 system phosphatase PglZ type A n=1 Tax=Acinetobacter sp. YH12117 TaxID=2601104 RepID=UPI0015D1CF50|nr:BREX-1 system phosphatase PglZ type A [Acinetobacter sp. YH12117]
MNLDQIKQGLEQAFFTENHRIVFWYDAEQSFTEEIKALDLDAVKVVNMAHESVLETKFNLELEDTQSKYLLYFPSAEPDSLKDWMLDMKLYSRSFYADRFSIIFNELGLTKQSVRAHLAQREKFLASRSRIDALKKHVQPEHDEQALDLAMVAALVKSESNEWLHILFALANEAVQENTGLEDNPSSLDEIQKYGLVPAWVMTLQTEVGYQASVEELQGEENFKLGQFLIRLLVTGFCESSGQVPDWAKSLQLSNGIARSTARAILSRWKDSSKYSKSFDEISGWVANAIDIQSKIRNFQLNDLVDSAIFEVVEQKIIRDIAQQIPNAHQPELNHFQKLISKRLDGHWASQHQEDEKRRKYRTIYIALKAAIRLFELRLGYLNGFNFATCEILYKAYEQNLYAFDQAYRHYVEASQRAHVEILKYLDDEVENCYAYWYIDRLAKNWGECLEAEQGLKHWSIPKVSHQYHFFKDQVKPLLSDKTGRRVAVIISDALRYEAAQELCERINDKRYSEASLSSQLGVLPSYTTLGMASLLPHETLEYKDNVSDDVFVDGLSSKGTQARAKILASKNATAFTADVVKAWKKDDGRKELSQYDFVYIYHNMIDARGDNVSTESETFNAVEDAITDLTELTHKILSNFNISRVIVTADHGFLFQQSKLDSADRTAIVDKPVNVLKSKKRYVIAKSLPETNEAWKGSTQDTAQSISPTDFWIPKGANRFHFVGGSRFVHGGAMLQEIVVPVITVKSLRDKKAEEKTTRKVKVISPTTSLKMVNNIQKFEFLQTEEVGGVLTANTITVAIYDGDKQVSSEETITFDASGDNFNDRKKHVLLSLLGNNFDRNKDYFLIIKDKQLGTENYRYKVSIDLITDDFF